MPGILKRLREAGEAFVGKRLGGEAMAFSAEIPGRSAPLWQMKVELQSEPQADGERLRLRVRTRLSLRRAALARPAHDRPNTLPAKVGRWLERRLESRLVQTMAAPLLNRDITTWMELQASSAALDEGSRALLPPRLRDLGIVPDAQRPVQTWAGALEGPRPGMAALTVARFDQSDLPPPLKRALGEKPFHFAAAIASVIEET
jgi:hypothetical protein